MAFQAVPNGALCTVHGTLASERVANTLGFGLITPGTVTEAQLTAIAQGVVGVWTNFMLNTLPSAYVLTGVTARALDVQDGPVVEESFGIDSPGLLAGAILPNNCSFVVSFRTGRAGATNRGRNYVNGLLESEVTGNNLSVTRINALAAAYANMLGSGAVATGWVWSVISRKIIIPTVTGRPVPIVSVHIVDSVVDSQRRRLPGRGQ